MAKPTQIHRGKKQSFRRHYLKEWLEERDMDPMDLVRGLNEADDMLPPTDKSQVYRWLKGQLPHEPTQIRIAKALELYDLETGDPDPERLLTHPASDWMSRRVKDLPKDEVDRIRQMIELAIPRTGTKG